MQTAIHGNKLTLETEVMSENAEILNCVSEDYMM